MFTTSNTMIEKPLTAPNPPVTAALRNAESLLSQPPWQTLLGPPRTYPPATQLFRQGDLANEIFYVERGLLKLTHLVNDGQEIVTGLRADNTLLGMTAVALQEQHAVTATTLVASVLRRAPAQAFLQLAQTDPAFGWQLQKLHSREVEQQADQLIALQALTARQRCEALLSHLLTACASSTTMPLQRLPLKQREIAQLLGITPEHLSRLLKRLKAEGRLPALTGGWLRLAANRCPASA